MLRAVATVSGCFASCSVSGSASAYASCVLNEAGRRLTWRFTRVRAEFLSRILSEERKNPCLRSIEILAIAFEMTIPQLFRIVRDLDQFSSELMLITISAVISQSVKSANFIN